jgi:hypothetical protein
MKVSKTLKLSKAKADKYFSLYIRKRDKSKGCITCNKQISSGDAGHFISRRFEATRYDEKNCHLQCEKCNRFEYGNQFQHGKAIDDMYGPGTSDSLLMKSKMFCKRDKFDYEYIAQEFNEKYNE